MSDITSVTIAKIKNFLNNFKVNVKVARNFPEQVEQIDNEILGNDKTGMVATIYNFMVHSATVPVKIETKNATLDNYLQTWQSQLLNKGINIDTPIGMRALSAENFKERWRSSLLALKVRWEEKDFGGSNGKWIVPTKMWFLNGGAIRIENEQGALNTRKYYVVKDGQAVELRNDNKESIFIRRPFTSQHKNNVVPYFTQRGTIYNALLLNAVTQKQAEVIEAIIPLILELKAGTDRLIEQGMVGEKQLKDLKKALVDAKNRYDETKDFGDMIASLRGDVNLDYLIPDLKKIFDSSITSAVEKKLLASLGMIELKGFSSNREEAILNPKVLIEEVSDAVLDWADLLKNVMIEMLDRNMRMHKSLANNEVRVVPGKIKAFITDDMRALFRSLYDRGLVSKEDMITDVAMQDFESTIEKLVKEKNRKLQDICYPPIIQNLEQYPNADNMDDNNMEDKNKKPGTPEADNFNNAVLQNVDKFKKAEKVEIIAPYDTIDDLPENVKNPLPVGAQLIWLRTFNAIYKETGDEDQARQGAWAQVKTKYRKSNDGKWVKKASLEDYESKMSSYTYKYFQELYETALEHAESEDNALETALAIIEKVSTKNKDGVLVKDKTLTKAQMEKVEDADVVSQMLNLELKEKKLSLLDKLLKDE